MKIAIELSAEEVALLQARAKRLGVLPEELARLAVSDSLARSDEQFDAVVASVLQDHAELYRRLA